MTTYTLDVDGFDIVIKRSGMRDVVIKQFKNVIEMKNYTQKQIKIIYCDCQKDGTGKIMMDDLEMFLGDHNSNMSKITDFKKCLENEEDQILENLKNYLSFERWLKLKKNHPPANLRPYTHVFWECGMSADTFNIPYIEMVTFGSAIDPLSKNGTKWPPVNDTIHIEEKFMETHGFGKSSISAKTVNGDTDSNLLSHYEYNVKVSKEVSKRILTNDISFSGVNGSENSTKVDTVDQVLSNFTKGNAWKKTIAGPTKEKVLSIIIKEWGDKLQVFFYIIFYYIKRATATATVTVNPILNTCDMVVFIICALFHAQCLYNGVLSASRIKKFFPTFLPRDPLKKYYSLLTFSTKTTDEIFRIEIEKIKAENKNFMDSIDNLIVNPDTNIYFQGKPDRGKPERKGTRAE